MLNKSLKAPWTPKVSSLTDTSNFDPMEDEVPANYGSKYIDNSGWDREF